MPLSELTVSSSKGMQYEEIQILFFPLPPPQFITEQIDSRIPSIHKKRVLQRKKIVFLRRSWISALYETEHYRGQKGYMSGYFKGSCKNMKHHKHCAFKNIILNVHPVLGRVDYNFVLQYNEFVKWNKNISMLIVVYLNYRESICEKCLFELFNRESKDSFFQFSSDLDSSILEIT